MQDHPEADIEALVKNYKDQSANDPSSANYVNQTDKASDAASAARPPATPTQSSQTSSNNQTGTIDGKPASHADAMAKFRDIASGMKLKLPGMDGQDGPDLDFSDPSKMGSQIQSHVGNMMKGMQGKMPQGKVELPGGMGNLDPNAMMQQLMNKMPKQGMTQSNTSSGTVNGQPADFDSAMGKFKDMSNGMNMPSMNENDELASWLKIAGIR